MVLGAPVRLFIVKPFSDRPFIRLLDPHQVRAGAVASTLFKHTPENFSFAHTLVEDPVAADFFVVPQSIKARSSAHDVYLNEIAALARTHGKQVLIFLSGDYAHRVHIDRPEFIVFKGTEYRSSQRQNEVVFAPFVEDLSYERRVVARKKGVRPVVSFCGYAGFPTFLAEAKFQIETAARMLAGDEVHARGIHFRRRAMRILERDSRIETRFIVRNSFSGNLSTAANDAATLRKEYLDNLEAGDFVLAPKGDANYSSRFFEALSLGRIPILIDTETVLPLSSKIDYDQFILRVPYQDVGSLGARVAAFWSGLSPEQYEIMQQRAREAFKTYLRYDAYFNTALPLLREGGVRAVL